MNLGVTPDRDAAIPNLMEEMENITQCGRQIGAMSMACSICIALDSYGS